MLTNNRFLDFDALEGPIDLIEALAERQDWDFERLNDEQIAMAIVGQWKTYAVTLAWSAYDLALRLVCTYEAEPPEAKLPKLYETLNLVNDQCWHGAFTYWQEQQLMVWRYALTLQGCDTVHVEQVERMIEAAVSSCERFYPCFALAVWGDVSPEEAMEQAINQAYGTA